MPCWTKPKWKYNRNRGKVAKAIKQLCRKLLNKPYELRYFSCLDHNEEGTHTPLHHKAAYSLCPFPLSYGQGLWVCVYTCMCMSEEQKEREYWGCALLTKPWTRMSRPWGVGREREGGRGSHVPWCHFIGYSWQEAVRLSMFMRACVKKKSKKKRSK